MADEIWKVALVGIGPKGEAIVNTFHYFQSDVTVATSATEFATQAESLLATNMVLCVTGDWTEFTCQASCITGHNAGKSGEFRNPIPLVGTLAMPSAPLTVGAIGRRSTQLGTRHSRGRIFISPQSSSSIDVNGGYTDPGGVAAAILNMCTGPITVGATLYEPCLYDKVHNQGTQIATASLAPQIGAIRRRKLRLPN